MQTYMHTTQHNTHTIQHNTLLLCTTPHYTTLHYTTLHYTTLHYTTLHCTQDKTMQYNSIQCTTIQFNSRQCNTTQHNASRCSTLQYVEMAGNAMRLHTYVQSHITYMPTYLHLDMGSVPRERRTDVPRNHMKFRIRCLSRSRRLG